MSDYDADALAGFDDFFGRVLASLTPSARRRAGRKLGQALLRANLKRIAGNMEPDGGAMEKRKRRLDARGRLRRKAGGKMFRRLRLAREWRVDAQPDSVEIMPRRGDGVARTHHFGLRGFVGKGPDGKRVFTRYPTRRLLGFAREDEQLAMDIAADLIEGD